MRGNLLAESDLRIGDNGTTYADGVWSVPANDTTHEKDAVNDHLTGTEAVSENQTLHVGMSVRAASGASVVVAPGVGYVDSEGNANYVSTEISANGTGAWQRVDGSFVMPSGMRVTLFFVHQGAGSAALELTAPTLSYGSPISLAIASHTPYATEGHLQAVYATQAQLAGYIPISGGTLTGPLEGNVTGNASTASRLSTARTIALSGAVSGSAKFDGSGDATIVTTGQTATAGADGLMSADDKSKLDSIDAELASTKTDLGNTKTDLASTKGELSGVNARLADVETRLNNLYNIVSDNFTTAKNDDASIRNDLSKRIADTQSELDTTISQRYDELRTSIGNTESGLRQLIDAKPSFKVFDLTFDDSATTAKVNATEAELGETAFAYTHFDAKGNTVQFDLEYSDGTTHRYTMYPHDIGDAIVVLIQRASGLGDAPDAYLALALQPYNDIFMTEDEYNGQLPPSV